MASRNIANMHLFLEMKTKFPYLPEDTLRNCVFLYAQDQAKCISMLQKESENHFPSRQQFSDFRPFENKNNLKSNENLKENSDPIFDPSNLNGPFQVTRSILANNSSVRNNNFLYQNDSNPTSSKSTAQSGIGHPLAKSKHFITSKSESHSAPVIEDSERPFISMFTSVPDSSHNVWKQVPDDQNCHNRMMFSTTKEHIIQLPEAPSDIKSSQGLPNSNSEPSKRHAVKLSITPALPFQQQQMNVYSNAVCATASHSSKPGRHTTSLNFQLQPQTSDQFPLEISTVPTNMGKPSNFRDFGSHVQISVSNQGTTFTALRLQRPSTTQNHNFDYALSQLPPEEANFFQSSSQALNSKTGMFPTSPEDKSCSLAKDIYIKPCDQQRYIHVNNYGRNAPNNEHRIPPEKNFQIKPNHSKEFHSPTSLAHSYQATPDYIQAVKSHQRTQLSLVQEELNKAKSVCSNLKSEVSRMELELMKRKENVSSSYSEVIKKLKEDNRHLRLECNCLLMEYDMCSKGLPVGITDEDFYSNIFTGPNDGLTLNSQSEKNGSKEEILTPKVQLSDYEDDEKNSWRCKKCTFVNHPALEKCEICEISKSSGYVEFNSNYSSSSHIQLVSPTENQPKRAVGSVQISVTRRVPTYSKSVKLHFTHRSPR